MQWHCVIVLYVANDGILLKFLNCFLKEALNTVSTFGTNTQKALFERTSYHANTGKLIHSISFKKSTVITLIFLK